ncbi:Ankyrin repeats (3 copies) [Legionella beliardensis]|uniref:Ankyrin repeats (3 copies) n=1 Tax=Legionella beliardensis TaxID=91822 RepID=A0A378I2S8_9GAMM|nr:ankyrin repeat domain-containing protein [Legionella beliardensis]STX29497.1 Ankyrin repeats (3 copies) [Legionella beliardensis]
MKRKQEDETQATEEIDPYKKLINTMFQWDLASQNSFLGSTGREPRELLTKIETILKEHPGISNQGEYTNNLTPFHQAIAFARPELINLLIKYGADVNLPVSATRLEDLGNQAYITPPLPPTRPASNYPLHQVLHDSPVNQLALIKLLLDNGADPFKLNGSNFTPLELANHKLKTLDPNKASQAINRYNQVIQYLTEKMQEPQYAGRQEKLAQERIDNQKIRDDYYREGTKKEDPKEGKVSTNPQTLFSQKENESDKNLTSSSQTGLGSTSPK